MSLLVIQLPPRERLRTRAAGGEPPAGWRLPQEWSWVLSHDNGATTAQTGRSALTLLPRADTVAVALAETDVGWHRVAIPRAPATRMRAALAGVLEEALLDDDEALHFALGPGAAAGRDGWVAVVNRPWLAAVLAAVEGAGRSVERVVPAAQPTAEGEPARCHFFTAGAGDETLPWLTVAGVQGVLCMRLVGGLARALLPAGDDTRYTATPAAAAAAEAWLGMPVPLLGDAERTLEAARGAVNLRQFDLAPRRRGTRALRAAAQRLLSPEWRPVRWGIAAVVALNLVGLNVYAWQQGRAIDNRRLAMNELLRTTYPNVRAVLDAPLQMQRETELLRAAAGRAGDRDFEVLLAAAAAAWPDGQPPVQTLGFEPGQLTLAAAGFSDAQQSQFRDRLRSAGFAADFTDGRITVSRAGGAA